MHWTAGVLFTLLLAKVQSSPFAGKYVLPPIPYGRRAQYYIIKQDGSYKQGFDSGDGLYQAAKGSNTNQVDGSYGYSDTEGNRYNIKYQSGVEGYLPDIPGVEIPDSQPTQTFVDPLADPNPDATYNFFYQAENQERSESSNSDGNIQGYYSYINTDGQQQRVDYEAGAGKGFVVLKNTVLNTPTVPGQQIPSSRINKQKKIPEPRFFPPTAELPTQPIAIKVPIVSQDNEGSHTYAFSYNTGDHKHSQKSDGSGNVQGEFSFITDDGMKKQVVYKAGADTGFIATGKHLPQPAVPISVNTIQPKNQISYIPEQSLPITPSQQQDRSYSFFYSTEDQEHSQSADSQGNVQGRYAFVADDGKRREINYEAGAEKGYVASGDYLPETPKKQTASFRQINFNPQSSLQYSTPDSQQQDGSFSFSYRTADQDHSQTADSDGYVKGSYGFVADDGVRRQVDFEAGADKGFVAEGEHIPEPPQVIQQNIKSTVRHTPPTKSVIFEPITQQLSQDGSYSFSYRTEDQDHSQTADSAGNVQGSYGFVADDGVRRQVNFEAGAEKGFVAQGKHIQQPSPSIQKTAKAIKSKPEITDSDHYQPVPLPITPIINQPFSQDRSYSFFYKTDDQHHSQTADSEGNVQGSYGFITDDGVRRQVKYEADAENGFVASGDHLPRTQVPSVKQVPQAKALLDSRFPDVSSSYSFSYDAGEHSRSESSENGEIQGQFLFKADDGIERKVIYRAGSKTGFVAEGDHLPFDETFGKKISVIKQINPAQQPIITQKDSDSKDYDYAYYDDNPDRSYSFSFHAGDSARTETVDKEGAVQGFFSFLDDKNQQKTVVYTADNNAGFVADGDHVPVKTPLHKPRFSIPNLQPIQRVTVPQLQTVRTSRTEDDSQNEKEEVKAIHKARFYISNFQPVQRVPISQLQTIRPSRTEEDSQYQRQSNANTLTEVKTQKMPEEKHDKGETSDHGGIRLPGGVLHSWTYAKDMDDAGYIFLTQ